MGKMPRERSRKPLITEQASGTSWMVPLSPSLVDRTVLNPEEALMEREALEGFELPEGFAELDQARPLKAIRMESLRRYYHRLHPRDSDYLTLYFEQGMTQRQMALLFEMTQPGVSYGLRKAVRKLQWLATVPLLDRAQMDRDLWEVPPWFRKLLWGFYTTTSQHAVGSLMGITQSRARFRLRKAVVALENLDRLWGLLKLGRTADSLWVSNVQRAALPLWDVEEVRKTPPRVTTVATASRSTDPDRFKDYLGFFKALIQDRKWCILQIPGAENWKSLDAVIMGVEDDDG